jgi:hypothetical protein
MGINRNHTDTVRKILALAEGFAATGNQAAADEHLAKAHAMMRDHAIHMHMIGDLHPERREEIVVRTVFADAKHQALIKAKRFLMADLAELNQCRTVVYGRNRMELIGHESDVEGVMELFNSIMLQLQTGLASAERIVIGNLRSFRVSYAHGYVHTVYERLQKAAEVRNHTDGTPGNALVLVNRTGLVTAFVTKAHPKLGKANMGISINSGDGYRTGRVDGARADLGDSRIGGGRTAITG